MSYFILEMLGHICASSINYMFTAENFIFHIKPINQGNGGNFCELRTQHI